MRSVEAAYASSARARTVCKPRRHVQSEIDHEQELQLEAVHLRRRYTSTYVDNSQSGLHRSELVFPFRKASDEMFMQFTP